MVGGKVEEARGSISKGSVLAMLKYVPAALDLCSKYTVMNLMLNPSTYLVKNSYLMKVEIKSVYTSLQMSFM